MFLVESDDEHTYFAHSAVPHKNLDAGDFNKFVFFNK